MSEDSERLRNEVALIPQRLTGFLIWESILLLAFAEILDNSIFLAEVLSVLGIITSLIGIINFWGLLWRIASFEGHTKKGLGWFIKMLFRGRGLGITCSMIFLVFWACAIEWSFFYQNTN